jgi:uncharacterized RDD family membrane protein YckC
MRTGRVAAARAARDAQGSAPPWRRLAAFGLDYLLIAGYLALLTAVGVGLLQRRGRPPAGPGTLRARLVGHAVGFVTLTLPVALYFALWEASPWQATPGKRGLGLRVVLVVGGRRVPYSRTLLRAAVKLVPWELAHTALWHTPGWPVRPEPTAVTALGSGAALFLAAWYVLCLFAGARRPPYDRAAGARVVGPGP